MAYQSRMRNYKSRRERYEKTKRNVRVIFLFALIAIGLTLYFSWNEIWTWLRTYFY